MSEDSLRSSRKMGLTLGDFEIEGVLGEGSFGFVLQVSRNGEQLALKEMSKHRLKKVKSEHIALIEKELVRSMKHPGVVSGSSAFQSSSKLYLALEYCGGGQFQQYVLKGMRDESKIFYFAELVNAVEYLHKAGIVHRDIKPSNLLLTFEGHLKVIDFGTACIDQCTLVTPAFLETITNMKLETEKSQELPEMASRIRKRKSTFVGTSQYMPPELIAQNSCEPASDLWAMGCILYFIYYGQCPFADPCELVVFQKIKGGKFSFPENKEISPSAKDLISRLLLINPAERLGSGYREDLSYKALKNHSFFCGLDIDNVYSLKPPHFACPEIQIIQQLSALQKEEDNVTTNNLLFLFLARKVHHVFIIFRYAFQEGFQLQQYEVSEISQQPLSFKLNLNHNLEIAKCLTSHKLMIHIINEQGIQEKLFFLAHSAEQCANRINAFYLPSQRETDLGEN